METNGNGELEGGGVAVGEPPESGDMAAIMESLKQMPGSTVRGVRRLLTDYLGGDTFMLRMATEVVAESENDQGADAAETAAGPPEYGNAGEIKKKVLAAFRAMGDEATQMLRIYMELMSVGGRTNCDMANEVSDAIYNDKRQGGEVADAPGALWLSGFHDAIGMINAAQ